MNSCKNILGIILFGFFVSCNSVNTMERDFHSISSFLVDTGAELYELEQVEAIVIKRKNPKLQSENVYACSSAGCIFSTKHKKRIEKHQEMHEAMSHTKIYRCKVCDYMIDLKRNMEAHKNSHNPQKKKWPCDVCGTGFNSDRSLKRHYNSETHQKHITC